MTSLHELQSHFKNYIFQQNLENLKPNITGDTAEERLEIYSGAYEARLLEAMEKIFPFLEKYLGNDQFQDHALEYIKKFPSTFYSIGRIGENFSAYLKNQQEIVLSDIVQLEWAISFAVDTADALPLKQQDLQEIPQDDWGYIVFEFHPSFQLLTFQTDAVNIYKKNKKFNKRVLPKNSENYCRVWRKGLQIFYQSLSETEYCMLKEVQQRKQFSEVCEALSSRLSEDKVVNYALTQLIQWLNDELMTGAQILK
jgi:hypothetical protein